MDEERRALCVIYGCICCRKRGSFAGPAEAHHLVDKGYRKHSGGDAATIPLCAWHHRGEPIFGWGKKLMAEVYGPSLAESKFDFIATFGTERELLEEFNEWATRSGAYQLALTSTQTD